VIKANVTVVGWVDIVCPLTSFIEKNSSFLRYSHHKNAWPVFDHEKTSMDTQFEGHVVECTEGYERQKDNGTV
jgi:hypothetical protein